MPDRRQILVNPAAAPLVSRVMQAIVRVFIGFAVAAAFTVATAPGASAGGSTWHLDREGYRPGDVAEARAAVAWEHSASLGTPEDGPYLAYLLPVVADPAYTGDDTWPSVPPEAWLVGTVDITMEPIEESPGMVVGPHGATVRFRIPGHLAPGHYSLLHCDDPCTTTLGDITWGTVVILNPDGSTPAPPQWPTPADPPPADSAAPDTAPPTTAAPTTEPPTTTEPPPATEPPTTATAPRTTAGPGEATVGDGNDDGGGGGRGGTATAAALGVVVVLGAAAGTVAVRRRGDGGSAPPSTSSMD